MNNTNNNLTITITKPNDNIIRVTSLTFSYSPKEDRIILVINHANIKDRIDLLITRRMMLKLLNAFDEILINHCDNGKVFKELCNNQVSLEVSQPAIKKEQKKDKDNKSKNNDDIKQESNSSNWEKRMDTNELDFTKTKEPMLLDSLSYNTANNRIVLKFLAHRKIQAISDMDKVVFQRTLSSMMRVIPFMDWGISPNILD